MKLPESFYNRTDVVKIARELLGKVLYTHIGDVLTGGMIVETEAYSSVERGSHAYGPRKTPRTSIMFERGGNTYVYLCYGMHHLFNVVTNTEGNADAVLIRALEPMVGEDEMVKRRGKLARRMHLTSGPGKLAKALGIDRTLNGKFLTDDEIWIEDAGIPITKNMVVAGPRIGIDYAGDDAFLPWRFTIKGNPWVSQ